MLTGSAYSEASMLEVSCKVDCTLSLPFTALSHICLTLTTGSFPDEYTCILQPPLLPLSIPPNKDKERSGKDRGMHTIVT